MLTEDRIPAVPARATVRSVGGLDQDVRRLWRETDPARIVRVATAALAVDRFAPCRTPLWGVVDGGRAGVGVTARLRAVSLLAADDFLTGQWDECTRLADEGIALCARRGYRRLADPLRLVRAHVAAARGEHTTATALLADVADPGSRRVPAPGRTAHQVSAVVALAGGDPERAFEHATAVGPAGTLPAHDHATLAVAGDLVEAARRTGRTHEAECHARAMRAAPLAARSPRFAMLALGAHAVAVSPGAAAAGLFEGALSMPDAERWAFDHARIELAYGSHLRRDRRTGPARRHLEAALAALDRLAAEPWAARCRDELRTVGWRVDTSRRGWHHARRCPRTSTRSPRWPPRDSPTNRSPRGSTSPRAPSRPASTRCSPSWGSPPAPPCATP